MSSILPSAEVLSTPRIFTSNNATAEINISQSLPYVVNQRFDNNGNAIFQYDFLDVGIILNVTPRITSNGYVTMEVTQTPVETIRRIEISVRPEDADEESSLARITGFYGTAVAQPGTTVVLWQGQQAQRGGGGATDDEDNEQPPPKTPPEAEPPAGEPVDTPVEPPPDPTD